MSGHERRREFTRVQVKLKAELRTGGNVLIKGQLGDVSLNGMYLLCHGAIPCGETCSVMIKLDGGQGMYCIQARGMITRVDETGMAIQFTEILGAESLGHLRNLVLLNSESQVEQVEQEFHGHVGIKAVDLGSES